MSRTSYAHFPVFLVAALAHTPATAGDLDPPAGPITSTMKTLTQVEPRKLLSPTTTPGDADSVFKITEAGSYYLTANIAGVSGKHGVEIAASGVTFDLSGFAVTGTAGSLDGISLGQGFANIAVFNGTISDWGDDGVDGAASGGNCIFERLRVADNDDTGIVALGSRVSNCVAINNDVGIAAHSSSVTDCRTDCGSVGISLQPAISPTPASCAGPNTNTGSVAAHNHVEHASTTGIRVRRNSHVKQNTVMACGGDGIAVEGNPAGDGCNIIDENTIMSCGGFGIKLMQSGQTLMTRNKAHNNGNGTFEQQYHMQPGNGWGRIVTSHNVGEIPDGHPWANFAH